MDDTLRAVFAIFVAEAQEAAQAISSVLLDMEADPSCVPQRIEDFYRVAHNLKGSSASLGIEDISRLAHTLESVFLPCRRGEQPLQAEHVDLGLRAMHAVEQRAAGVGAETERGKAEVAAVIEALAAATADAPTVTAAPETQPPDAEAEAEVEAEVREPSGASDLDLAAHETAGRHGTDAVQELQHGDDLGGSVRVPPQRLRALDERLEDMRTLHRRLTVHAAAVAEVLRQLQGLGLGQGRCPKIK